MTGAADTGRTASTEQSDLYVNLGASVTWATGAITNQRFTRFAAPTIAFVGASTVTNAATVYIDNAPQAGANATLTNAYALWVDAGATRLDGAVTMGLTLDVTGAVGMSAALTSTIDDAATNAVTRGHTLAHDQRDRHRGHRRGMLMRAESGAGTLRSAGAVDAIHGRDRRRRGLRAGAQRGRRGDAVRGRALHRCGLCGQRCSQRRPPATRR